METSADDLGAYILQAFHIRGGSLISHQKLLVLFTGQDRHLVVVTRKQLLEMSEKFLEAAGSMPSPS
jgi:hypothetical protein